MMKHFRLTTAVVALLGLLLSAQLLAAELPMVVSERVAKARAAVKQVEMAALKETIDKPLDVMILDVREPSEFDSGHIPGAVNLPRGLLEFKIWNYSGYPDKLDTTRTIYVYCATAARSALATETLTQLGFTNVYLVNMQLEEWKSAEYPLEASGM